MISRCIALIDQPLRMNSRGQIIEQFGMRRRLAADAEVVGRLHQPAAEVILPDAIDHHAGRQRIVGAREPLGQFQPAAPFCIRRKVDWPRNRCCLRIFSSTSGGKLCEISAGQTLPQAL